ncbi:hypothetical protein EGI22_09925 [Lacihabitans sp. LS3-19]|uniref:carboxypeptidase-like regulatory domain-containing protein n=1 Tax=Lacihabitans sp. LS3-19 TaxID=2487335 RepID=UPI0020CBD1DD|nr:carboxypeptidase-like regulatory domain-containing protein [Lacihabitans sp. LS3-19]MCP9768229.1 hypothetical protein [Lacihabitans sp. LS3-19]
MRFGLNYVSLLKKLLSLLLLIFTNSTICLSQVSYSEGVIISNSDAKPVQFANIQDKANQKGVTSDSLGRFKIQLNSENTLITISCVGFKTTQTIASPGTFIVIGLEPNTAEFAEITITPDENPAWAIMRKAFHNIPKNDPKNIPEFKAEHYTKIGLNGDFLRYIPKKENDKIPEKESTLILVENIGKYFQKNKVQKDVIEHSISTFPKNYPFNLFTNTQINPLGFYEPLFQLNLNLIAAVQTTTQVQNQKFYLNPLHDKTFSNYELSLTDTLITGKDSTFTILFGPRNDKNFNALTGFLKINSNGYALEEFSAKNADSLQVLNFNIYHKYSRDSLHWTPNFRSLDIKYRYDVERMDLLLTYFAEEELYNFKYNIEPNEVHFDGTARLILPSADTISKDNFKLLRINQLKLKEEISYQKAAMANQKAFNQKVLVPGMFLVKTLLSNGLKIGPMYVLYNQMDFNIHEGPRIGIGLQNDMLKSPRWRIYVGSGYGLKDQKLKYEGILSYHITKDRYNKIEIYGGNDLQRPGQNPLLFANYFLPQKISLNLGFQDYLLDSYRKLGFAAYMKPFNWTQVKIFYENEIRNALSYTLENPTPTNYNHLGMSLRFAKKETIMRTGYIESVTNPYFPILRLNFSHFTSNIAQANTFWKANLVVLHQIRMPKLGKTNFNFSAGNSWGTLPFQYLFNNLSVPLNIWGSNSSQGFQMLSTVNLAYNNYVSLAIFHDFEKILWRTNSRWFQPEFMIGNKIAVGKLTQYAPIVNSEPVNDIRKGVFEASLSIRNIFKIKVFGFRIGLGANLVYDYSPQTFGNNRFGIRPFVIPVFF